MRAKHAPPAAALLLWYDAGRRELPWRRAPNAYKTLVSELMLQQTVVATVVPYFERFLSRFPDLAALAAASEEEVLALWSGLGYYSRGRNLHRAAQVVLQRHGGALPASEDELRALPGVGPYTAAAIASIAFGVRTFALDGNAARVIARLFAVTEAIDVPAVRVRLRSLGESLVPADRPGDFAQAVMELGARVCGPRRPRCDACPIADACAARSRGTEATLPLRSPRREKRLVAVVCAAVERQGRVLLVRRPAGTLLGGTWTLPAAERMEARASAPAPDRDRPGPDRIAARDAADRDDPSGAMACRAAVRALGLAPRGEARPAGAVRHVFTHRDVTATVFRQGADGSPDDGALTRWVGRDELDAVALSSFTRKTLALLWD